jgi:hypothetical protein
MPDEAPLPALTDWEPTRQTLHLYIRAIGVVTRAHAEARPNWWHISLKVHGDQLRTDKMARPDGGEFWLVLDLKQHKVVLYTIEGSFKEFDMTQGLSGTQFGDALLSAVGALGLSGNYARQKFQDDEAREYNAEAAGRYLTALLNVDRLFKEHRSTLQGDVGPVQLWPHNFDLALEWFGTRLVRSEEDGQIEEQRSQINLGFYAGDPANPPYFYSNPWPFEAEKLMDKPLPQGARWFDEGWQGTILPYDELAGDENAEGRLKEYARTVYEIASPTLLV